MRNLVIIFILSVCVCQLAAVRPVRDNDRESDQVSGTSNNVKEIKKLVLQISELLKEENKSESKKDDVECNEKTGEGNCKKVGIKLIDKQKNRQPEENMPDQRGAPQMQRPGPMRQPGSPMRQPGGPMRPQQHRQQLQRPMRGPQSRQPMGPQSRQPMGPQSRQPIGPQTRPHMGHQTRPQMGPQSQPSMMQPQSALRPNTPRETMNSLLEQQSLLLKSLENTEMIRRESQTGFQSIKKGLNDIEQLLRGTFQDGFGLKPKHFTLADVPEGSKKTDEETQTETTTTTEAVPSTTEAEETEDDE